MADRALRFDLVGRDKSLGRTLDQGQRKLQRFGTGLAKLGALAAGAFAGVAVVSGIRSTITAASDLNESLSKTRVVFGRSSKAVEQFAKGAARNLGQSRQQALEATATFGNLFVAMKLGQRPAAAMSIKIVKLASDLASFNNVRPEEALEALRSGLVGETEPLRRFGINLNDADLRQRALALGLVKTTKKVLPPAIKAQAAYSLIMEQSKTAQGDFARTAGGAANQQRIFAARVADLKARIGQGLLPVFSTLIKFVNEQVLPGFGTLAGIFTAHLGPALGRFVDKLRTTRDILKVLGPKAALKSLFPADLAPTIDAIATAVGKVAGRLTKAARTWATTIIDGLTQGLRTGNYRPLGEALADAVLAALRATGDLGASVGRWVREQFGKVDWFAAGKDVGRQAFPFVIGFSATLVDGLITAAREHPMDTVLFFASFLAVGKIGGVIAKLLARIPFLRAFAPLFEGLNRLTGPLNDTIGRVLGSMGRAFLRGLGVENPRMGRALARSFDGLRLRIWAFRDGFGQAGLGLIEGAGRGVRAGLGGLGRAFATVTGVVVRFLGRLLGPVAAPFLRAGSNLIERLATGIRSAYGAVNTAVSGTVARLVSPFRAAGTWLVNAGRALLSGLATGIRAGLGGIGGVLSQIRSAIVGGIKRLFGIKSPSSVMAGLGSNIVAGIVKGLVTSQAGLRGVISKLGVSTRTLLGAVLGGAWDFVAGKWQKITAFLGGALGGIGSAVVKGSVAAIVRAVAATRGWGSGAQWNALSQIISHESGWRPTAQNPTSTAYGLFQLLDSTWAGTGIGKTSDPFRQTVAGLRYIASRYGSPIGAWNFWQAHHWYGKGLEGIISRPTLIGVGESGPEAVSVRPLRRRDHELVGAGGVYLAAGAIAVYAAEGMSERRVAELVVDVIDERARRARKGPRA